MENLENLPLFPYQTLRWPRNMMFGELSFSPVSRIWFGIGWRSFWRPQFYSKVCRGFVISPQLRTSKDTSEVLHVPFKDRRVNVYVHMKTYVYIYICIHTYVYIHTYVCVYVHIHTDMCIYIYTYLIVHLVAHKYT